MSKSANIAAALAAASPILVMHGRYEQSYLNWRTLDRQQFPLLGKEEENREFERIGTAMRTIACEHDTLRQAILYQVPTTWPEAMLLCFHLRISLFDDGSENEHARKVALTSLFDFMCCQVQQEHADLGAEFQTAATKAFFDQRYRAGNTED